ncbi:hypothetical protein H2201_006564 [Coniosporium apollinis]|uniref:BRCT domain-containing protein n=1 Tax=Coniosporium apollinis TaxID=61459 RepID=A0ABQ9NLL7_9PEZI|nr:hypothetical protein H2201_006564 [Coniosporium apollinis]
MPAVTRARAKKTDNPPSPAKNGLKEPPRRGRKRAVEEPAPESEKKKTAPAVAEQKKAKEPKSATAPTAASTAKKSSSATAKKSETNKITITTRSTRARKASKTAKAGESTTRTKNITEEVPENSEEMAPPLSRGSKIPVATPKKSADSAPPKNVSPLVQIQNINGNSKTPCKGKAADMAAGQLETDTRENHNPLVSPQGKNNAAHSYSSSVLSHNKTPFKSSLLLQSARKAPAESPLKLPPKTPGKLDGPANPMQTSSLLRCSPRKAPVEATPARAAGEESQMRTSLLQQSARKAPIAAASNGKHLNEDLQQESLLRVSPKKAPTESTLFASSPTKGGNSNFNGNMSLIQTSPRKAPLDFQPSATSPTKDKMTPFHGKASLLRTSARKMQLRSPLKLMPPPAFNLPSPIAEHEPDTPTHKSPHRPRKPTESPEGPAPAQAIEEELLQYQSPTVSPLKLESLFGTPAATPGQKKEMELGALLYSLATGSSRKARKDNDSQIAESAPQTPVTPSQKTPTRLTEQAEELDSVIDFSATKRIPDLPPLPPSTPSRVAQQAAMFEEAIALSAKGARASMNDLLASARKHAPPGDNLAQPLSPTKSALRSPQKFGSPKKTVTWTSEEPIYEEPPQAGPDGNLISDCVFYVDVRTVEGADAGEFFIPLLEEMGATVVSQWTSNSDPVTHVLFKDGEQMTLEKVVASNGAVKCVNIAWPIDCERFNHRVPESAYLIDLSHIPGQSRAPTTPRRSTRSRPNTPLSDITLKLPINTPGPAPGPSTPKSAAQLQTPEEKENVPTPDILKSAKTTYSPTTPYFLHPEALEQKTCPAKQEGTKLFEENEAVGEEKTPFKQRLLRAKAGRMSMFPAVGGAGRGLF